MKKKLVLTILAVFFLANILAAQDVDRDELSSTAGKAIEFINYVGPHSQIDSISEIRGIGAVLGRAISDGGARTASNGSYRVIHAVDPTVDTGFDADIIIIDSAARVDHIDNLRRIIAGYLEAAYGYSEKDSNTLALFISIYNAVYRGDIPYFSARYKQVVMKELDSSNAGLSIRWDEWAGRSRIVIPLSSGAGKGVIGSVETGPITDDAVIDSLVKEMDSSEASEQRQDMVDIKEKAIEEEEKAIATEKEAIADEEKAIAEERARIDEQKEETASLTDQATLADREEGDAQEGRLTESEIAKAERELEEREKALEEKKEELATREEKLEEKIEDVRDDREAIARDQQEAIEKEIAARASPPSGTILFKLENPGLPLSRIVDVNLENGDILRRSDINTIRNQTIVDIGNAWLAIAGTTTAPLGAIRIARIEKNDLAKVSYSDADVFPDSVIWKYGSSIYAIVKKNNSWAIGRFNAESLELEASSEPVSQWTFLAETGKGLVAQDAKGNFIILEPMALSTVKALTP